MPSYSPSAVVNVITPLQELEKQGHIHTAIHLEHEIKPTDIALAEVIILCRNVEPIYKPMIDLALELGIPLIYDLDDNLLAPPTGSDAYYYYAHPPRKVYLEWILSTINLIRVHSPTLGEVVRKYNSSIGLRWAAINWSLVPPELPSLDADLIHLVYAAQRETGQKLFNQMQGDLQTVLARHAKRIRLHFLGYTPRVLCGHPAVVCHPFESNYQVFFRKFTRFGYAIGLAPMLDDEFHNCKTNIKFRDYAAAGAAGIYSDVPLYNRNGVISGETGLLISGQPGTWLAAIESLLADRVLLESIRQKARAYAQDRYALDRVLDMWLDDIASLPARPPITPEKLAEIAGMKWWFQGIKQPDKPLVAKLRALLRGIVPMPLKVRYYAVRYTVMKWRKLQ